MDSSGQVSQALELRPYSRSVVAPRPCWLLLLLSQARQSIKERPLLCNRSGLLAHLAKVSSEEPEEL